MHTTKTKFAVGQIVHHKLFDYRGVIVDVDATFQGSDQWYEQVARTRPPKFEPWYRVLVHQQDTETYVAERNLEPDPGADPIEHPDLKLYFDGLKDGHYTHRVN